MRWGLKRFFHRLHIVGHEPQRWKKGGDYMELEDGRHHCVICDVWYKPGPFAP